MNIEKQGFFRDVKQLGEEYVQERLTLIKLEGAEKAARMSAVLFTGIIVSLLLIFGLFFLSLMGVYFVYQQTANWYLGLGIMAVLYLLIAVLILLLRKTKIYPLVTNKVISILFEKSDHEL
ncbi:MAG: phage holin family protein [Chitinophagaceae bacterium]